MSGLSDVVDEAVKKASIYPEEYLDIVEGESVKRWRAIKEAHRSVKKLIDTKLDVILDKLEDYRYKAKMINDGFLRLFSRSFIQSNTMSRALFSQLVTLIAWINTKVVDELFPEIAQKPSTYLNVFTTIKYLKPSIIASDLVKASGRNIYEVLKAANLVMNHLAMLLPTRKNKVLDLIDPEYLVYLNPLSAHIINSLLSYHIHGAHTGKRIGLYGVLGAGKTTTAFYSIYSVLRAIGLGVEESLNTASALVINDPYILIYVFKKISESSQTDEPIYVPAIVADDIAGMVSKYWFMDIKEMRQAISELIKALKVSREFIGAFIFPSDASGSIPKAIAESLDEGIESETINLGNRFGTLWFKMKKLTTIYTNIATKSQLVRKNKEVITISAITSPPIYMPQTTYESLTKFKLKARELWLRNAEHHMKEAIKSRSGGGEVEGS